MVPRRLKSLVILAILSVSGFLFLVTHRKNPAHSNESYKISSGVIEEIMKRGGTAQEENLKEEPEVDLIPAVPVPAPKLEHKRTIQLALDEIQAFASNHINQNAYNDPKTIFIVTTWRSGSTFFGEAISSHPAVYYHYEPLTGLEVSDTEKELSEALYTIENLSRCDYNPLDKYISVVKNNTSILAHNKKLARACQFLADDCFNPDFLTAACNNFPIQVFKFVRIHAEALAQFLETPDVHLIYLVRDPRSIFGSRTKLSWCMQNPSCGDANSLCNFLTTDLMSVNSLISQYPTQVHVIKYEDLATAPTETLKNLFEKLRITWDVDVEKYLEEHTKGDKDEPWSTHRVSKLRIQLWKTSLKSEVVKHIQEICSEFMDELNYSKIDTSLCETFC